MMNKRIRELAEQDGMKTGQELTIFASGVGKSIFWSRKMNERIRELAKQAEKYADDNFKGEPTYSEAYDSKFAELIIEECIQIVHQETDDSIRVAMAIETHFGVEE